MPASKMGCECEVDNCCGCMRLKTGVQVLGWSFGLLTFVETIVWSAVIAVSDFNVYGAPGEKIQKALLAVYVLFGLADLAISLMLVIGSAKGKRSLMIPFMILLMLGIVFLSTGILGSLISGIQGTIMPGEAALSTVWIGIEVALRIYFFIVVKSLYVKLDSSPT